METIVLRSSAILKNSPSRGVFLLFHQTAKIVRLTMRRTPTAAAPAITGVFIPPDCLSASVSGPVPVLRLYRALMAFNSDLLAMLWTSMDNCLNCDYNCDGQIFISFVFPQFTSSLFYIPVTG